MFERSELALKVLCWAMLALVIYRLVVVIAHINPLYHLTIPALPTLSSVTTGSASGTTNSQVASKRETNAAPKTAKAAVSTNLESQTTKTVAQTNQTTQGTNSLVRTTNSVGQVTNAVAQVSNVTAHATNSMVQTGNTPTNAPASLASGHRGPEPGRMGMPGGGMPGGAKLGPELPKEMQSRIDRVIESEILAPVMRPLPLALLGIAGNDVFLRAPNGQTGLVKEGEELGGVKLLRIGINRVLVEDQGERKELTIFAGMGGESLLTSTQKDSSK
jgi:hypothetical protein